MLHSGHVNVAIIISTINTASNIKNTSCTCSMPDTLIEPSFMNSNILYVCRSNLCLCTYRLEYEETVFSNLAVSQESNYNLTIQVP